MHELGHNAGLGHSDRPEDVMGFGADKGSLANGDREAMKALYEVHTSH